MVNSVCERFHEFIEVFFVEENLMLFISETIVFEALLARSTRPLDHVPGAPTVAAVRGRVPEPGSGADRPAVRYPS